MNKKRILLLILTVTLLLTGCVKYELDMSMKNDKSITITIIDSMQKEYVEAMQATKNNEEYKKLGYTVTDYNDSKFTGLKLTKKFNNIDEISSNECKEFELTDLIKTDPSTVKLFCSKKIGETTTYIGNYTYNLSAVEQESAEDVNIEDYTGEMIFKYTMKLPDIALLTSDNADEKSSDNKTLTWNIKYGELKYIKFAFNINDKDVSTTPIIDEEETSKTTTNTEQQDQTTIKSKQKQELNFGSLIGSLAVIGIVGITIFNKIKDKKSKKTTNKKMAHQAPPRNK